MVQVAPTSPEALIVGLRVKEAGEAVNLVGTGLRKEKVANHVQRGVSKIIDRIEPGKREVVERAGSAASPEIFHARCGQTRARLVPPAEVDLEADGHAWIAETFTGFPVRAGDERAEMVGNNQFMLALLTEAERQQNVAGPSDVLRWAI